MDIKNHFSVLSIAFLTLFLVACEMAIPPFGPIDRPDDGQLPPPVEAPDTIGWNIPSEAITVAEARAICAELESGAATGTKYYVMGYVKKIHNNHASGITGYGNAQFYMEDVKGANSGDEFMAFQVYGPNSKKLSDPNCVLVGDFVIIYGELTNYNGTYETTGKGSAHIWKSTNPLLNEEVKPEEPEVLVIPEAAKTWNIPAEAIDVMKAREICASLASGATTDKEYYVMGYVKKLHPTYHETGVKDFGNATFYMENINGKNSQNDFLAFQVYGPNGTKINDPNSVAAGDFVVVYGKLTNFNGTFETVGKAAAYVWKSTNPLMVETKPEPEEIVLLEEDLSKNGSIDTFTVVNTTGDATWKYNRKGLCVQLNGADNEDWLITPTLDLTNMSEASLIFKYKFNDIVPAENQDQYTVLVSKDFDGNDVSTATWVALDGFSYEANAYTETEAISLPAEMIGHKCHIAWKYKTQEVSHTWSLKNITVKAMTKVD